MRHFKFAALALLGLGLPYPAHANLNELFTELFGRPREARVRAGYEFRGWAERPMKGGEGGLRFRQQVADLSIPLSTSDSERWRLDLAGRLDEPSTAARLSNGRAIPDKLWDSSVGVAFSRQLPEERAIAASLQLGSNGDAPFRHGRDVTAQANLIYRRPAAGPEASWLFALNFSTNRNFANYIPIPGVAYFFRPTESLRLALGVPFLTALWSPLPKTVLNISYFPINNVQARFSYFPFGPAQAYAQLRYQTKNFLPSDRTDARERLFYEEAVAQVGFTSPLSRSFLVDLFGGYSFDRKFFYGRRTGDKSTVEVLRPEAGPFASLRLIASF